jgi:23S rRNA pseudouridine1911/1915/1917 synthase
MNYMEEELDRLDKILVKKFNFSRNYSEILIKNNNVYINGMLVKNKHKKYKVSDNIEIIMNENVPIIKYISITDDYIIVNKPLGISCCRCSTTPLNEYTLNELVKKDYSLSESFIKEEFGLPHRIDKDTEGLVLMSRTKEFYDFAVEAFKNSQIEKKYLCLVSSKNNYKDFKENDTIKVNLLYGNDKVLVKNDGLPSETNYEVISSYNKYKILLVTPITGRRHQIRVILNFLNAPIIGDKLYGGQDFSRLCLFASELKFTYKKEILHFSILNEHKHLINNLLMHLYF